MKIRFDLQFIKDNQFYVLLTTLVSLAIAVLASYRIYIDLGRLETILIISILGFTLLCESLFIIALQLLSGLIDVWFRSKPGTGVPQPGRDAGSNPFPIVQPESSEMSDEHYSESMQRYEQEKANEKTELVNTLIAYVKYTMPKFVSQPDMTVLCDAIRSWSENPAYRPEVPIRLKEDLTTNDLRHFIWNIGERLGQMNGYDGECRAQFVKALFSEKFKGMEESSIRNMRNCPDSGCIHIDVPRPGCHDFAFQRMRKEGSE